MKKAMKKTAMYLVILAAIVIANTRVVQAAPSSIRLDKSNLILAAGKSANLKVSGTSKKIKWKSSDKKVATVNQSGKVTAKKAGSAKITACVGSKKLTCTVKVKAAVKSIRCSKTSLVIESGDTSSLKVTANPSSAKVEVHWKSSDKGVVTVDQNGNLVAKKAGSAKITAIMADGSGKMAVCKVQVVKAKTKGRARTILTTTEELFTEQYQLKQKKYLSVYKTQENLLKNTICISCVAGARFSFRVNADVVAYQPAGEEFWEYVVFLDNKEDVKPFYQSAKMKAGVIGVATDWQLTI